MFHLGNVTFLMMMMLLLLQLVLVMLCVGCSCCCVLSKLPRTAKCQTAQILFQVKILKCQRWKFQSFEKCCCRASFNSNERVKFESFNILWCNFLAWLLSFSIYSTDILLWNNSTSNSWLYLFLSYHFLLVPSF